ncbi:MULTISPECIES: copper ion binding protein [unclassified Sporolactobacillus]|uniref:copper ion binding protein n=1 Tax=unclassified Sporolactobacillus TaxID=2628533 RepID=UPI002368C507|nr:copper ion binding protein [Sporolactobacillus sp. CQH2019]MDD9148563.1 copper ion binding protein [Sporolactobacillus sp. CQH2019]
MAKTTLEVKGMMSDHCKHLVTKTLKDLDGVSAVDVDLKAGKAAVEYDESKVQFSNMKEAVEEKGYDVVGQQ